MTHVEEARVAGEDWDVGVTPVCHEINRTNWAVTTGSCWGHFWRGANPYVQVECHFTALSSLCRLVAEVNLRLSTPLEELYLRPMVDSGSDDTVTVQLRGTGSRRRTRQAMIVLVQILREKRWAVTPGAVSLWGKQTLPSLSCKCQLWYVIGAGAQELPLRDGVCSTCGGTRP